MEEFKGTKSELEKKYIGPICIGIGTVGNYSQITANSILPETDDEYEKEKEEIEANMSLYAAAPEMLDACMAAIRIVDLWAPNYSKEQISESEIGELAALSMMRQKMEQAINKALGK